MRKLFKTKLNIFNWGALVTILIVIFSLPLTSFTCDNNGDSVNFYREPDLGEGSSVLEIGLCSFFNFFLVGSAFSDNALSPGVYHLVEFSGNWEDLHDLSYADLVSNSSFVSETSFVVSDGSVVNGICSFFHYDCSSGSSSDNVAGSTSWTWSCVGSGGGSTSSCSEEMITTDKF